LTYFKHSTQHDWKSIGGVTVKFKSGVTAILREIAHFTIMDPDPDIFPIPKLDLGVLFFVLETAFKSS
jgi:hypothetical protein